ncbi:hypothetical protein chiPu_0031132, partial [Chiloscyllium punctatum]|nr:hypothetical protein [Chiloscyllium punctatum]
MAARLVCPLQSHAGNGFDHHHLWHQELRHHEEGARLARRSRRRLRLPRLQDRRDRQGQAQAVERGGRLGDAAQPRRHHLQEAARF